MIGVTAADADEEEMIGAEDVSRLDIVVFPEKGIVVISIIIY
jgi:hypothetical protein